MHPLLATRGRTLLYLAGWVPILALLDYLMWASGGATWVQNTAVLGPACFLFAFACLSPWPICRVRPLRLADAAMLAVTWAAAAAAASAMLTGAAWAMARMEGRPAAHLDLLFGVGILLYLLSAGLHYASLAAEASREASLAAAEARMLARDAELHALRMQINPHFLFNSLHSIAALATTDGVRAREMCIRLADFLRSSLGLGGRDSIPLREELALARSYLEVEQVRFGARLEFSEDIQESCRDCAVPVLLLQPLVENAVKHGIAGLVEGGAIRLSVERLGESVRVAVENGFDPDAPPPNRLGMGLPHVRRRLELRYGASASLQAGGREGVYRVELRFPCESPIASSSRA
jgi:two-component system, LytTR family, sensor histidine kinase AlgZ